MNAAELKLKEALELCSALKDHVDPNDDTRKDINEAWGLAWGRAMKAAREYVDSEVVR